MKIHVQKKKKESRVLSGKSPHLCPRSSDKTKTFRPPGGSGIGAQPSKLFFGHHTPGLAFLGRRVHKRLLPAIALPVLRRSQAAGPRPLCFEGEEGGEGDQGGVEGGAERGEDVDGGGEAGGGGLGVDGVEGGLGMGFQELWGWCECVG